jgi:hypothetical protein
LAFGGIQNHGRPADVVQSRGGSSVVARVDAVGGDLSGAGESSQ